MFRYLIGICKKLLKLLNIRDLDDDFRLRLRCIGKLEKNNNIYSIDIRKRYVSITINGEEVNIQDYLKSREFYTREQYMKL